MNTAPFVMTVSRELAQKEPHLTLEFLSEVVAGFQQYTPALKQFCLAYMSPWLPNLSLSLFEATATDHEKVNCVLSFVQDEAESFDSKINAINFGERMPESQHTVCHCQMLKSRQYIGYFGKGGAPDKISTECRAFQMTRYVCSLSNDPYFQR